MPNEISRARQGRRSLIDRGLDGVAGLVLSSGGDPNSARSVLPGMATMTAACQFIFIIVPAMIALEFGWEPRQWQVIAVATLALFSFTPILVGFMLLVWSKRRRRRKGR